MKTGIGMRNVKTGIAVLLCVAISRLMGLESPFFAAIAAVISMENSITNSIMTGKNRMMGTFVGALAGLAFAYIEPNNVLLIGAGIIIVIYICNLFKWNKSVSIACVVFIAIMINMNGKSPLIYSVNRLIDTLIGIVIAILVNYFIFPYTSAGSILKKYHMVSDRVFSAVSSFVGGSDNVDLDVLKDHMDSLAKQLEMYTLEFEIVKGGRKDAESIKKNIGIFYNIYSLLSIINRLESRGCLNDRNIERLKSLGCSDFEFKQRTDDDLSIVYNYLMEKVTDDLQKLDKI